MDATAESNILDEMRNICREFQELNTGAGKFEFLLQHTGLDAGRLSRIETLGHPWPLGFPQGSGAECVEEGIRSWKALLALSPLLDMEPAADEHDPSLEVEQHLRTVATRSGEGLQDVCCVFLAELGRLQRCMGLCHALCIRLDRAPENSPILAKEFTFGD